MKITPLITTFNGNPSQTIEITEKRKIIVIKNKKKTNKNYYSYQLNVPMDLLNLVILDGQYDKKINRKFCLQETNKQTYDFNMKEQLEKNDISIGLKRDLKKRNCALTLPKRKMEYLKAYDIYQDVIETINQDIEQDDKKFEVQPLMANLIFDAHIKKINKKNPITKENETHYDLIYDFRIYIKTNIDKDFINFAKKENANMDGLPGWLETLIIDWDNEKIKEVLDIESNVNKWQY